MCSLNHFSASSETLKLTQIKYSLMPSEQLTAVCQEIMMNMNHHLNHLRSFSGPQWYPDQTGPVRSRKRFKPEHWEPVPTVGPI